MIDKYHRLEELIDSDVQRSLKEDLGTGDITSNLISQDVYAKGSIITREDMVLAGSPWVSKVFSSLNENTEVLWFWNDGDSLKKNTTICSINGQVKDILSAERTALNFLQLLSAIATRTRELKKKIGTAKSKIFDTRKTIPGLRGAQKYAVRVGGGENHRIGLFDQILFKENHLMIQGGIDSAIRIARINHPHLEIQVEVESVDECKIALKAKPNLILLDNFSITDLKKVIEIRDKWNQNDIHFEASGGITDVNIAEVASTGVERISIGTLTKDIKAIDLTLRLDL